MTFEQLWLFLLMIPPVLWMIFNSRDSSSANSFVISIVGTMILLAICLPGFTLRLSNVTAGALVQALAGLSDTDLKHRRKAFTRRCNARKRRR